MGDFKPTDSAIEFKEEVTAKIDAELARLEDIYIRRIPEFNKQVKALEWDPVEIKTLESKK